MRRVGIGAAIAAGVAALGLAIMLAPDHAPPAEPALATAVTPPPPVDAGHPRHDAGQPKPDTRDAGPPSAKPTSVVPVIPTVRASALKGRVQVRRAGRGSWRRLRKVARLSPTDEIRTAGGASVELVAGQHVVQLQPGTQVEVGAITEELTRFLLGAGLVRARARGQRTLQIDSKKGGAGVSAKNGAFSMSHNGDGTVAVGVQRGRVRVSGGGSTVVLRKGQQTLVPAGGVPAAPRPLSRSLLLKVNWPQKRATNKPRLRLTGKTRAGALVFAMGRPVKVAADGSFTVDVRLKEGENHPRIEARDVGGNRARAAAPAIVMNTKGAKSEFETETLWGK